MIRNPLLSPLVNQIHLRKSEKIRRNSLQPSRIPPQRGMSHCRLGQAFRGTLSISLPPPCTATTARVYQAFRGNLNRARAPVSVS
jgi:hypothetical protein